jgi:hypothetical protein
MQTGRTRLMNLWTYGLMNLWTYGLMDGLFFFDPSLCPQEISTIRAEGSGVLKMGGIVHKRHIIRLVL